MKSVARLYQIRDWTQACSGGFQKRERIWIKISYQPSRPAVLANLQHRTSTWNFDRSHSHWAYPVMILSTNRAFSESITKRISKWKFKSKHNRMKLSKKKLEIKLDTIYCNRWQSTANIWQIATDESSDTRSGNKLVCERLLMRAIRRSHNVFRHPLDHGPHRHAMCGQRVSRWLGEWMSSKTVPFRRMLAAFKTCSR